MADWKQLVVDHLNIRVTPVRRAAMYVFGAGVLVTNVLRLVTDAWWLPLLGLVFVLGLLVACWPIYRRSWQMRRQAWQTWRSRRRPSDAGAGEPPGV